MKKEMLELKDTYSTYEAKTLIDEIMKKYGEDCRVDFLSAVAELTSSYKVTKRADRRVICEVIRRTGLTDRTAGNLAAEWMVHNVAWYLGLFRSHAKDASLDYTYDPRAYVRFATSVFDILSFE